MSRPDLSNHPAVSFTVKRPSSLSRETSDGDSSTSHSFKPPAAKKSGSAVTHPSPLGTSTGKRPAPKQSSRNQQGDDDSSDEDAGTEDEIITGFDSLGVQRADGAPKRAGPLVIPALKDRDWRAIARKRAQKQSFVPDSARALVATGKDGSVGGLGTRDTINSGPQISGIVSKKRLELPQADAEVEEEPEKDGEDVQMAQGEDKPQTEDERALRALIAGDDGSIPVEIDAIPLTSSTRFQAPATETDAYREDVLTRPDSASMDDYARVPIEQFGAALLRGMGWQEGMAASKTRKGLVEPYLPPSRPALLGIGAKERVVDEPAAGAKKKFQRPDKKYVPVVKRARDGTIVVDEASASGRSSPAQTPSSSRRSSRSPRRDYERDRERGVSGRERDGRSSSYRDRDYRSDRERDGDRDSYGRSDDRDRRREEPRDRDRDRDRRRDDDRRGHESSRNERERSDRPASSHDRDRDREYRR